MANRNEVKELIEMPGRQGDRFGYFQDHYLINNDVTSTSSKNKKANDLGIPIISEETFLKMVEEGRDK